MFQLGNDLGFAFEPQAELRIGMQKLTWQDFDGDFTFEAWIVCPVDRCHAAPAQLGLDFVDANFLGLHEIKYTYATGRTQALNVTSL
jgi:hypothetical protein